LKVAILFNPISGAGKALAAAELLKRGLETDGVDVRLRPTERRPTSEWLAPALTDVDALVVAGGDGAVRMAAPEAARARVPLWHAPCGTENLFARAFGMRADPRSVARALVAGKTRAIDLARADHEHFNIMASVGFDADVVHVLAARRTGAISHLSYARPILELARAWKPSQLAWSIDGEREELGPGLVVVGNLREYGVRLNPTPDAQPDDGLLDAVYLPARGALDLLSWVPLLRFGLAGKVSFASADYRARRGQHITLEASPAAKLQLDGDAATDAPAAGAAGSGAGVRGGGTGGGLGGGVGTPQPAARHFWTEPSALRVLLPG
jgi:diacylglycerol kinase (ATP)